jgi:hypothetical protein
MSARLRSHVRNNVIGYLALFVALSGSAYAVTAPRNSISSKSIRNGQVRSPDLQDNGVAGIDLQDGGVQSGDIQDGGVQSIDLAPGAVQATNLAAGAIGAPGFARISSSGSVLSGRGVAGVTHTNGTGTYCITMNFTPQVAVASADAGPGTPGADAEIQIPGGPAGAGCNANQIAVVTEAGATTATVQDLTFYIVVN